MPFKYEMTAATDIGQVRESNQDSIRIVPAINLAVVADGMGGHKSGDIASRMAVNSLCEYFQEQMMINDETGSTLSADTLMEGFSLANSMVYLNAHQIPDCEGMGTTMVAGSFQEDTVYIGHIGDSRIYDFSQGNLTQLTTDHTLAAELSADTPDHELPAYSHHVLKKAMGIESTCSPDFFSVQPQENHIFLMCSDGLTGVLSDHDISTILSLRSHQPEQCLETMINACLDNGAPDNVSIILVFARSK